MREEAVAVKVWADHEIKPEGDRVSNFKEGKVPPHWFREEPAYAAELYALELGCPLDRLRGVDYIIFVIDNHMKERKFKIHVAWSLTARVTRVHE